MGVAVDETGYDHLAAGVDYLARVVRSIDFSGVTEGNDAAGFDSDRAVFDHVARLVHRDHGSTAYD